MPHVFRTREAVDSLLEIWDFVAQDSVLAADRLLRRIDDVIQRLALNPSIGEARPDLAPDLRCFSTGNYVILFRPTADGILVVLVTQGARDILALYRIFSSKSDAAEPT